MFKGSFVHYWLNDFSFAFWTITYIPQAVAKKNVENNYIILLKLVDIQKKNLW